MAGDVYRADFWIAVVTAAPVIGLAHTVVITRLGALSLAADYRRRGVRANLGSYVAVLPFVDAVISAFFSLIASAQALDSLRTDRNVVSPRAAEYFVVAAFAGLILQAALIPLARLGVRLTGKEPPPDE